MDCFDLLVVNIGIRLKEIRAKHLCKDGRWIGIKTVLWEVHRNSQTEEIVVATLSVIWVGAMVLSLFGSGFDLLGESQNNPWKLKESILQERQTFGPTAELCQHTSH